MHKNKSSSKDAAEKFLKEYPFYWQKWVSEEKFKMINKELKNSTITKH